MSERKPLSRRQFLRGALVGVSAAAAPVLISACGGAPSAVQPTIAPAAEAPAGEAPAAEPEAPAPAAPVDVTLLTSGWPLTPMPTAEDIAADPARQGYAEALQTWMDANPGVTIEQIEADIWDQQAVVTAISGGTAPIWVFATSIGGWTLAGARAAFVQGLMADVTTYVDQYDYRNRLTDIAKSGWEQQASVDGRYFSTPLDAGINGTIFYRRDLIRELGLEEPKPSWTWADFRALAKALTSPQENRRGFGAQATFVGSMLNDYGFDLLTQIPAPETSWNWRRDFSNPQWAQAVATYRAMIFEDQSVLTDTTLNNDGVLKAFTDGTIAMTSQNILSAFGSAASEDSIAALAQRLGKPYQEVVGFASRPRGENGHFVGGVYVGGVSYSPDATPETLQKAVDVVDYMFLGKGWDIQKAGQYAATQDLQAVFNYPIPIDGKYTYEGVPGTFADAWGQETLDAAQRIASIPLAPDPGLYFPAENNPGPDTQAIDDAWSTFSTVAEGVDVAATLQQAQDTWNTQAQGFSSSVADEEFVEGARAYYADVEAFWQQNSPQFYEDAFKPWYESTVKPALG